jgi:hypothetical protein
MRTARETQAIAPAIREAIQPVNPQLVRGISTLGEAMTGASLYPMAEL